MKNTQTTIHVSFTEDDIHIYQRLKNLKELKYINMSALIRKFIKEGMENER